MAELRDDTARHRFELDVEGSTAFVEYRDEPGRLVLVHTEVPAELGGKGVGSRLAAAVLDEARRRGRPVKAECEFIASYIERHPAYRDLLEQGR